MKTLIYSGYSDANAELNALTQPVREAYARRHGYDCITDKVPWEKWKLEGLRRIQQHLSKYDIVLCVGSDVLFTNHRKGVLSVIDNSVFSGYANIASDDNGVPAAIAGLTIAKENIGWWPVNNDVALWSGKIADDLLGLLINDADKWLEYSWLWQNHIWNLMQTDNRIRSSVTIVEGRVMNSVPVSGLSRWQLGDWILHAMDGGDPATSLQRKIAIVKQYLPMVGDGTFYPEKFRRAA